MQDKQSILSAIIVSAILTIAAIVFLTIFGELNPVFKAWLTNTFSHHWIGKGILSLAIFGVVGFFGWFLPIEPSEEKIRKILNLLNWLLILGTLAILGFFVWEALLK